MSDKPARKKSESPSILRDPVLLRRIAASARPYRSRIALLLVLVLGSTMLPLSQPVLLRELIDDLGAGGGMAAAVWPLVLIGVTGLLGVAAAFVASRVADGIGHSVTSDLQRRLFDHLVSLPLPFYTTVRSGTLVSRITNDVYAVEPLFTSVLSSALASSLTLATAAVVLLVVDPRLALVLLIVPLVLWPVRLAEARINSVIRTSFQHNSDLSNHVESVLNRDGVLLARQAGAVDAERARFAELAGKVRETALRLASWRAAVGRSYDLVFTITTTALLAGGAILVTGGNITLGTLILFLLYLRQIQAPVSTLIGLRYPAFRAGAAFTRVFDVLDSDLRPATVARRAGGERAADDAVLRFSGVRFDHVSTAEVSIPGLSHAPTVTGPGMFGITTVPHAVAHADAPADQLPEGHRRVLNGIDLTVAKGQTVAIVGESGAGKSTIAMLAAGLFTPTAGEVLLGGVPTTELTPAELANSVALITQETHVRHESIAENLRYVCPDASDSDLVEACEAAQLDRLVRSLPDGYQTVVGEKGYRFSGGERQRLSVARALLTRADLVILDEPTSQLDAVTEEQLDLALRELFADRAVLLMAHRLRTVRSADRILVLADGSVREDGTHDELLATPDGRYARFYRSQVDADARPGRGE
ncbi:ABC transporter ATP-binding protein [Lentzea sp. JNUCC 0626]|uniref:ABC transporter ATP-binding protein n=1 Tax=Lentzea sp. JNUCC 0626 TaxID=3367513 RepID=UPI00374948D1